MAAIENVPNKRHKKNSFIKKSTVVDLTPMVDLGFLLITFFVFTTTLSTPTVMNLNMPYDKVKPDDAVCESCVLTVLLSKNNIIGYYEGFAGADNKIKKTGFGKEGIRNIILQKRKAVNAAKGTSDDFVLIIKPGTESTFQNFIDIVDEVAINNIKHYYNSETDQKDMDYLKSLP